MNQTGPFALKAEEQSLAPFCLYKNITFAPLQSTETSPVQHEEFTVHVASS